MEVTSDREPTPYAWPGSSYKLHNNCSDNAVFAASSDLAYLLRQPGVAAGAPRAHSTPSSCRLVELSLRVSLTATLRCGRHRPCRSAQRSPSGVSAADASLIVLLNALMGLPPVVVGLVVYLLLSRAGPLGSLGLLFTPAAMVDRADRSSIVPIIAALSRQIVEDAWHEYDEQLRRSARARSRAALTLLWDTRFSLVTVVLAGFGRAAAEVGAVMIVGGNIDGVTRVMTTTIALETSKGDLPLALGLGIDPDRIVVSLNAAAAIIAAGRCARYG